MLLMSLMCAVGVVVVVVVATIVDVAIAEVDAGRGAGEEVVAVVEDVGAGAGVVDVALVLLEPLHDGARRHKHHAVPQLPRQAGRQRPPRRYRCHRGRRR